MPYDRALTGALSFFFVERRGRVYISAQGSGIPAEAAILADLRPVGFEAPVSNIKQKSKQSERYGAQIRKMSARILWLRNTTKELK